MCAKMVAEYRPWSGDDEIEGLQVKHGDGWVNVQPVNVGLIINICNHLY